MLVLVLHFIILQVARIHPNGSYIATGSSDHTCRLWDINNGACVRVFTGSKVSKIRNRPLPFRCSCRNSTLSLHSNVHNILFPMVGRSGGLVCAVICKSLFKVYILPLICRHQYHHWDLLQWADSLPVVVSMSSATLASFSIIFLSSLH